MLKGDIKSNRGKNEKTIGYFIMCPMYFRTCR